MCTRNPTDGIGIKYYGNHVGKCIGFRYVDSEGEERFIVRQCKRKCAVVCRSDQLSYTKEEYCENHKLVTLDGSNYYGFWMYKTENNPGNNEQDNKQTFNGGDGFCQGKKGSLPHLYNSDFVEAAENEVKSKLGK